MAVRAGLRKGVAWALIGGCLMLAGACLTADGQLSEPVSDRVDGEFTHSGARIAFPESINDFERGEVTRYDESGKDLSVGYNLVPPDPVAATVYVYPGRDVLNLGSSSEVVDGAKKLLDRQEFEGAKDSITATTPGLTLVLEDEAFAITNPSERVGRRAIFEGKGIVDGEVTTLRTEVDLFGYGDWFVKYRFTYSGESPAAPGLIIDFMNSLAWSDE